MSKIREHLAEELGKFENGEARYATDGTFTQALNSLSYGVGAHAVLDSTLRRLAHQNNVNANLRAQNAILTNRLKNYEYL
jgi:GH24 family phage-related lysozyme (muramidase)